MKVRHGYDKYDSVEEFVADQLDGAFCDRGRLESIDHTTRNVAKSYARLLALLVERGVLNEQDLGKIVKGYESEDYRVELLP